MFYREAGKDMAKAQKKKATPRKPTPVVLSINICDAIIRDETTKKVSLIGIFNTIQAFSFPTVHPLLHLYMALTNGHGKYKGEISLSDNEGKVLICAQGPLEFRDPLQVVEINFEWRLLKFEHEGEYIVEVACDGQQAGTRKFRVVGPKIQPTSGTQAR
jgi:hypothetical protein